MNDAQRARSHRFLTFGVLCNQVLAYRYGVPKRILQKLHDYRLSFESATKDEQLGKIAENRLQVCENLIRYATSFNLGATESATEFKAKAIELHDEGDRLINEVIDRGI